MDPAHKTCEAEEETWDEEETVQKAEEQAGPVVAGGASGRGRGRGRSKARNRIARLEAERDAASAAATGHFSAAASAAAPLTQRQLALAGVNSLLQKDLMVATFSSAEAVGRQAAADPAASPQLSDASGSVQQQTEAVSRALRLLHALCRSNFASHALPGFESRLTCGLPLSHRRWKLRSSSCRWRE